MSINRKSLYNELFSKFFKMNREVEAIIVSDRDGLIIAGETREDIDMELISILTAVVNPVIERFRSEFSYRKFGTANFDTDNNRILFISITETIILTIVIQNLASIDNIAPYAYLLAEKVAQILFASDHDLIEVSIPDFEYKTNGYYRNDGQFYQIALESGRMYKFKFIIIGDHEVGKTSIIRRFVDGRFLADYRTTIGLNVLTHKFEFFGNHIDLILWDIGAQKYFKRYRKVYYKGAQAAIIVFDLTNRESFFNIKNWYNELNEFKENDLSIVIVGNKRDLEQHRKIEYEEAVILAEMLSEEYNKKISYIETSALSGENIKESFGIVSYHYIMLNKIFEENKFKEKIITEINSLLEIRNSLILTFISNNYTSNPALILLKDINELGIPSKKEKKGKVVYNYPNGLILESYNFDTMKAIESDGVFIIFDAKNKDSIDPNWNNLILKIVKNLDDNKVISICIITKENVNWSKMMGEFDFYTKLEERNISYFIFRASSELRLELYEQLNTLLGTVQNL